MANYPATAPSFSNKTPGQTIASAHINAIQDEVVAIGGGLLNGTAPVVSSNITAGHISAGTSTFTGIQATASTITNMTASSISATVITAGAFVGTLLGTWNGTWNVNSSNAVFANVVPASSGTAGGVDALPATPAGYLRTTINGSTFVIPYYNP